MSRIRNKAQDDAIAILESDVDRLHFFVSSYKWGRDMDRDDPKGWKHLDSMEEEVRHIRRSIGSLASAILSKGK